MSKGIGWHKTLNYWGKHSICLLFKLNHKNLNTWQTNRKQQQKNMFVTVSLVQPWLDFIWLFLSLSLDSHCHKQLQAGSNTQKHKEILHNASTSCANIDNIGLILFFKQPCLDRDTLKFAEVWTAMPTGALQAWHKHVHKLFLCALWARCNRKIRTFS